MGLGSAVLHTGGDEVVMGLGLGLGSAVLHTGGDEVVNHAVPRHDVDVKAVLLVDGHCRAGLLAHVPDAHLARVRVRDGVRDGVRVGVRVSVRVRVRIRVTVRVRVRVSGRWSGSGSG